MDKKTPLQQICFMVMPFGIKETGAPPPAPAKVDFDALWRDAIRPALLDLGYRPVRADQEIGSMIIKDMLQRLYFSHVVVADVSIPNANAYYEVGIRHAAKSDGCVLIAAKWAQPVFDLGQIRRLSYPNPETTVDPDTADQIKIALQGIKEMAASRTPMCECIEGYPHAVPPDENRAQSLADQLEHFESLRSEIAVVAERRGATKAARIAEIVAEHPAADLQVGLEAFEMVKFLRDAGGDWSATQAYIDDLPQHLREIPWMREQHALARSKQDDHHRAIEAIKTLIALSGDTSERQGLLGGRYKRLYEASVASGWPDFGYLNAAIEHYERGTLLDLSDYFPSCNLPALYRQRNRKGDDARAVAAAAVARLACESARLRGTEDEWLRSTLLGLAFAEGNVDAAEELADQVEAEPNAGWKLETTLATLRSHVMQAKNAKTRKGLTATVERLSRLLPAA